MKNVSAEKKVDAKATSSGDVEMKEEKTAEDIDKIHQQDIKEQLKQIERSVTLKEPRYLSRVLRSLAATRKSKLNENVLVKVISVYGQNGLKTNLQSIFPSATAPMDTPSDKPKAGLTVTIQQLPEADVYLNLLVLIYLIDNKQITKAVAWSDNLSNKVAAFNRRTLDPLAAVCYFYHSRVYELTNKLNEIRPYMHARLRTATLRSDKDGQAMLLNLLLRNYIHYNLFDQADKLISKSTFPESATNNDWARYLCYIGLIKAIQLDYTEAHKHLENAVRKAPQQVAIGFKQHVTRLAIVVQLLLGEIPDRKVFREKHLKKTLEPYLQLTQAVRMGNLNMFNGVIEEHKEKFQTEKTYTLIIRLRHSVIKTGIRMISLSYSKISLQDVAQKLCLDSAEDAEFIVAKAIRDGVIDATLDHEKKFVQSKEIVDVYSTSEPQSAFHQRITFSLDIYNQSVKAMRYPPKSYNKDLESLKEQQERERQDLEYAKEIAENDDDDFL